MDEKKRIRRQGKDLVADTSIADTRDAKDHGKIQFRRTHPFRAASNDVSQTTARSNVDMQFTMRLPVFEPCTAKNQDDTKNENNQMTWYRGLRVKVETAVQKSVLFSVSCAFCAAHCADYYITKYSSKSLQTFSPLMLQLHNAMERLREEENKEESMSIQERASEHCTNQESNFTRQNQPNSAARSGKPKGPHQRARRVLYRMLYAANRSFWLSCTELYVIVATGAAGWSTHYEKVLFLAKSLYMAKSLKRNLENKSCLPDKEKPFALEMLQTNVDQDKDEEPPESEFRQTTSLQDDYMHRGPQLKDMSLYVYAMHITRISKSKFLAQSCEVFFFDGHYALFNRFAQGMHFYAQVPRLVGPPIPTLAQDPETNALIKTLLFTPYACPSSKDCASPKNMSELIAQKNKKSIHNPESWSFVSAWANRRTQIENLAEKMRQKDLAEIKMHTLPDCVEFRSFQKSDNSNQDDCKACALRYIMRELVIIHLPLTTLEKYADICAPGTQIYWIITRISNGVVWSQTNVVSCAQAFTKINLTCRNMWPELHGG